MDLGKENEDLKKQLVDSWKSLLSMTALCDEWKTRATILEERTRAPPQSRLHSPSAPSPTSATGTSGTSPGRRSFLSPAMSERLMLSQLHSDDGAPPSLPALSSLQAELERMMSEFHSLLDVVGMQQEQRRDSQSFSPSASQSHHRAPSPQPAAFFVEKVKDAAPAPPAAPVVSVRSSQTSPMYRPPVSPLDGMQLDALGLRPVNSAPALLHDTVAPRHYRVEDIDVLLGEVQKRDDIIKILTMKYNDSVTKMNRVGEHVATLKGAIQNKYKASVERCHILEVENQSLRDELATARGEASELRASLREMTHESVSRASHATNSPVQWEGEMANSRSLSRQSQEHHDIRIKNGAKHGEIKSTVDSEVVIPPAPETVSLVPPVTSIPRVAVLQTTRMTSPMRKVENYYRNKFEKALQQNEHLLHQNSQLQRELQKFSAKDEAPKADTTESRTRISPRNPSPRHHQRKKSSGGPSPLPQGGDLAQRTPSPAKGSPKGYPCTTMKVPVLQGKLFNATV